MTTTTAPEPKAVPKQNRGGRWWQRKEPPRRREDNAIIGERKVTPYLFSFPAILLVAGLLGYPVIYGVWQSFYRRPRLGAPPEWVGVENYSDMFSSDAFWDSLNKTAIFVGGSLIIGMALGLFFAFALFKVVGRLRFLRAVTIGPYIVSNVAAAVMFRILFNAQFGTMNQVIEWLPWVESGPRWLADPTMAMVTVIFTQVWTDLPLVILLLLGGLMTIDNAHLDAALVDGASGWNRARHITVPLLAPQILISIVWLSFSTLTGLGVVLALTGGGPLKATQTMAMEMYTVAFRNLEFNQGLAIATFVLVLNAVLTLAYVRIGRRYDYDA
ncbi:MAG: sugar ABC transporter permease [Acidimicrobiia bacterium]|jgi:ABC-type sugar transport system permease subunit|nr:sugar ABC transporter permease [Acidimicrobiia bacterium]